MATKAQIKKILLPKQIAKLQESMTWNDVLVAINENNGYITVDQQTKLVNNLKSKDYCTVGKLIAKAIAKKIDDDADVVLNGYLVNNTLDLTELGEVL